MIAGMKLSKGRTRLLAALMGVAAWMCTIATPAITWAQSNGNDSDAKPIDARLYGFSGKVALADPGSSGLCWVMLILLCLVTVGVMFKSARRSHLD